MTHPAPKGDKRNGYVIENQDRQGFCLFILFNFILGEEATRFDGRLGKNWKQVGLGSIM